MSGTSPQVSIDSVPAPRGRGAALFAWAQERFPFSNAPLFFILYLTALFEGRAALASGQPLVIGAQDLFGLLASWAFFLMLRVFDEHKDYALDCQNHPERVLQRGEITLGHLKVVGAAAILLQLGYSLVCDGGIGPITAVWLIVMAYSALMAKEFFVPEWLGQRLLLYAASHMVVMPLALIWMLEIGARGGPLPRSGALLCAMSFLSGAAFEVTRKTKGPEEERPTIDSYSRIFGPRGAAALVLALLSAGGLAQVALLATDTPTTAGWPWAAAIGLCLLPAFATLLAYRKAPSARGRKLNEMTVGLSMMFGYGLVLARLIVLLGLRWS